MAQVYWIHCKTHRDIFTEGYVGFTTRTAEERFKEHVDYSKVSSNKTILKKAFDKYGLENMLIKVICECSKEYGLELEAKLRPTDNIGWNAAKGGGMPPGVKGLPVRPETREKLSAALSGRVFSEESRQKMSLSAKKKIFTESHRRNLAISSSGRKIPRTESHTEKLVESFKKSRRARCPWTAPNAKKDVWKNAAACYRIYDDLKNNLPTIREICRLLNVDYSYNYERLVRKFKKGWNPLEDADWRQDFMGEVCIKHSG